MKNRYIFLGLVFCLAGAIFAPIAYLVIVSVSLTSFAISVIIIGFTAIALGNSRPAISPEMCQLMLETGTENASLLLEELGLKNKAIYLPSSMGNGHSRVIVPLTKKFESTNLKTKIPDRLIIRYGPKPEEMGISISTPGGVSLSLLELIPSPTQEEIQNSAANLLVNFLGLASSVVVAITENTVTFKIKGLKPNSKDVLYYDIMGSPTASIAAAITSEALGKPIRIKEEIRLKGKNDITLEVLG